MLDTARIGMLSAVIVLALAAVGLFVLSWLP